MITTFEAVRGYLLLAFGFGFVIFWHELGHFLAAKWAGVKVEQFAVGFGQAVVAWRKGLGFRVGTTAKEFERKVDAHLAAKGQKRQPEEVQPKENIDGPTEMDRVRAAEELGLSETEYRLNWIPLGGYVKMMGQDDLKPNTEADDPRAYNRQTIGKRMVIVSAGVVMNVILAAIGFMVLFLIGFHVPPAVVGSVIPLSPAQQAMAPQASDNGLRVGDRILTIDGKKQYDDWTKVQLNAALSDPEEPTAVEVEREVDGQKRVIKLMVRPRRGTGVTKDILGLGIGAAYDLKAISGKELTDEWSKKKAELARTSVPDLLLINPGDVVIAVNGKPVEEKDFAAFDRAIQASQGAPVKITVRAADGTQEERSFTPRLMEPFDGDKDPFAFAGMLPRVQVEQVVEGSPAYDWLKPGDLITAVITGKDKDAASNPSYDEFRKRVNGAGKGGVVDLNVLRGDGTEYEIHNLRTAEILPGRQGLKIVPGYEQGRAVVADVTAGSAAAKAQVPPGARVVEVGGRAVSNWHEVYRAMLGWLAAHPAAEGADPAPVPIVYETSVGERISNKQLPVSAAEAKVLAAYRFRAPMQIGFDQPKSAVRHESSPVAAAGQGMIETRDFILQFYLTLRRMVTGDVSTKNMMGPLGIFQTGSGVASKGPDWLIWFLSMISANLAVVNFLPIPIVDGGLFTFLVLEKVKGKPLSPKTQAVAQYVGMALLLGVFLFVTWQDIAWWSFRSGK